MILVHLLITIVDLHFLYWLLGCLSIKNRIMRDFICLAFILYVSLIENFLITFICCRLLFGEASSVSGDWRGTSCDRELFLLCSCPRGILLHHFFHVFLSYIYRLENALYSKGNDFRILFCIYHSFCLYIYFSNLHRLLVKLWKQIGL